MPSEIETIIARAAELEVSTKTCTVNGDRKKGTDPAWTGLDLDRAEVREKSTLMAFLFGETDAPPDHHLRVPWMHLDDRASMKDDPDYWCFYRVRPKRQYRNMRFQRRAGAWWLVAK